MAEALKASDGSARPQLLQQSPPMALVGGDAVLSRGGAALDAADEKGAEAALRRLLGRGEDAAGGAALGAMQVLLQSVRVADPSRVDGPARSSPVLEGEDVVIEPGAQGPQLLDGFVWCLLCQLG